MQTQGLGSLWARLGIVDVCGVHGAQLRAGKRLFHRLQEKRQRGNSRSQYGITKNAILMTGIQCSVKVEKGEKEWNSIYFVK